MSFGVFVRAFWQIALRALPLVGAAAGAVGGGGGEYGYLFRE